MKKIIRFRRLNKYKLLPLIRSIKTPKIKPPSTNNLLKLKTNKAGKAEEEEEEDRF